MKTYFLSFIIIIASIVSFCFPLSFNLANTTLNDDTFQEDTWTSMDESLFGGTVISVAIDPSEKNKLFAATPYHGIFMSINRGETWSSITDKIRNKHFTYLLIDPYDNNCLYAASSNELYRTYDNGLNWEKSETIFPRITSMYVSPGSSIFITTHAGVYLTQGKKDAFKFYALNDPFISKVHATSVSGNARNDCYAVGTDLTMGLRYRGVAVTLNFGSNWHPIKNNLPEDTVISVFFDPNNFLRIYAVMKTTGLWYYDVNIYETKKDSIPWNKIADLPVGEISFASLSKKKDLDVLIGTKTEGVYKYNLKNNELKSFSLGSSYNHITSIATTAADINAILIGNDIIGCFISTDYGTNWNMKNHGIRAIDMYHLEIAPSNNKVWYAGSYGCVFSSTDTGKSWNRNVSGLSNTSITSLCISPKNENILFLGSDRNGLYTSTNGARSFSKVTSFPFLLINCILMDHHDPNIIYVGTHGKGVYKSTNSGKTWSLLPLMKTRDGQGLFITCMAMDPKNPRIIYAGTNIDGIFKSKDGGDSWEQSYSVLGTNIYINEIVVDKNDSNHIYAGINIINDGGIIESKNQGKNWETLNMFRGGMLFKSIHIDLEDPRIMFAGTNESIFISKRNGKEWNRYDQGLNKDYLNKFNHFMVNKVLGHPFDDNMLLIASRWGIYACRKSPLTMDLEPPTIVMINPKNTETCYTNQDLFLIQGKAHDEMGIKSVNCEDRVVEFDSDSGAFSLEYFLRDKENTILITATDRADNTTKVELSLFLDEKAPFLTLISPLNYQQTEINSVLISGSAIDHESGIDRISINNEDLSFTKGQYEYNFQSEYKKLTPGENALSIKAFDKAGNFAEKTVTVNFKVDDKTPPIISLDWPILPKTYSNKSLLSVRGKIIDEESGVFKASINGKAISLDDTGMFEIEFDMIRGQNRYTLEAIDYSNNSSSHEFIVIYDPDPPEIILNIADPRIRTLSYKLIFNVSDPLSGVFRVSVKLNNNNIWSEDKPFDYPPLDLKLSYGENIIEIEAEDYAGNTSYKKQIIEFLPPKIIELVIGSNRAYITDKGKRSEQRLDAAPQIHQGRTMVPLRFIGEAFGAEIKWIPHPTNEAQIRYQDKLLHLWIGKRDVIIEYPDNPSRAPDKVSIDAPPIISNGRTMVPIRFIAEQFNAKVDWNNAKQQITISWEE